MANAATTAANKARDATCTDKDFKTAHP
jgi:hypothetical protein